MGVCASNQDEFFNKVANETSTRIDKELRIEKEKLSKDYVYKLLLVGAGETGKSTVLKQLRLIHGGGMTDEDREKCRRGACENIISIAKSIIDAMEVLKIPYGFDPCSVQVHMAESASSEVPSCFEDVEEIESIEATQGVGLGVENKEDYPWNKPRITQKRDPIANAAKKLFYCGTTIKDRVSPELIRALSYFNDFFAEGCRDLNLEFQKNLLALWADSGVQYCVSRNNEFQLLDSYPHYMGDLERFCKEDYAPTDKDILLCRIMTTGISETKIRLQDQFFSVIDMGGQRSIRKKWVAFFDDAAAIIFMVAISSFDQTCVEDEATNRSLPN